MNLDDMLPPEKYYPTGVLCFFLFLLILIFLCGLSGNLLTILVIIRTRFLHTKTNFYLCSLALSDVLLLLFGLPYHFATLLLPGVRLGGDWLCIGRSLVAESSTNASILTIMIFTFERYWAICKPFRPCGSLNPRKVFYHIAAIWAVSVGFASLLAQQWAMKEHHIQTMINLTNETSFDYHDLLSLNIDDLNVTIKSMMVEITHWQCEIVANRQLSSYTFVTSSIIFFVVPMALLAVVYSLIVRALRQSLISSNRHRGNRPYFPSDFRRSIYQQTRARTLVIRMLIVVVTCFFISFLPFHSQRLLTTVNQQEMNEFKRVWYLVALTLYNLNTCCNFLIYHLFSKKFRVACWKLCCGQSPPAAPQANLADQYRPVKFISSSRRDEAKLGTKGITPDVACLPIIRITDDKTLREFGIGRKISAPSGRPLLQPQSSSDEFPYIPSKVVCKCMEGTSNRPVYLAVPQRDDYGGRKNRSDQLIQLRCQSHDVNQNENFRVIPVSV